MNYNKIYIYKIHINMYTIYITYIHIWEEIFALIFIIKHWPYGSSKN